MPDELQARGLPTIGAVDHVYDVSGSLGGPIQQDKLWFFSAHRWWGNSQFVPGLYFNRDTSAWTYEPDLEPAGGERQRQPPQQRPLHLAGGAEAPHQPVVGPGGELRHATSGLTGAASPEGVHRWNFGPPNYLLQATWSYPMTNRLLFEAGNTSLIFDYPTVPTEDLPLGTNQISVLEADRLHGQRRGGARRLPLPLVGRRLALRPQDLEAVEPEVRRLLRHRLALR